MAAMRAKPPEAKAKDEQGLKRMLSGGFLDLGGRKGPKSALKRPGEGRDFASRKSMRQLSRVFTRAKITPTNGRHVQFDLTARAPRRGLRGAPAQRPRCGHPGPRVS